MSGEESVEQSDVADSEQNVKTRPDADFKQMHRDSLINEPQSGGPSTEDFSSYD
jgi:hypothetical protein